MKKIFAIIIIGILLSGCGNEDGDVTSDSIYSDHEGLLDVQVVKVHEVTPYTGQDLYLRMTQSNDFIHVRYLQQVTEYAIIEEGPIVPEQEYAVLVSANKGHYTVLCMDVYSESNELVSATNCFEIAALKYGLEEYAEFVSNFTFHMHTEIDLTISVWMTDFDGDLVSNTIFLNFP